MTTLPTRSRFPGGFVFGTATSAYQIEGHARGGAGRTHWDDFAAVPGNVIGAEDGAVACDHLSRLDADLDLLATLGVDAYRFSASWARVLPDGRGPVNTAGLDFYDRLVDGLVARGIKPALTLYHWELPSALADLGGWRNRDIAQWFGDYTDTLLDRIGDRVWSVAPINEPVCVGWLGHFTGHHAPGLRDIRATARAMHHILLSHAEAIGRMRARGQPNLGAVINLEAALPASDVAADRAAAARHDSLFNRFFLQGLTKGTYPDAALDGLGPHLPLGWQEDMNAISAPLDWVGLNYYTCKRIAAADGPWPRLAEVPGPLPKTDLDWEIYPQGLADFLVSVAQDYTGDTPLYVTENGMAAASGLHDEDRISYLARHLASVQSALANGVPVAGYFVWSLMDNYEWAFGYGKRFGLVEVDFETLARRPKASFEALAKALSR
ncbi:GH1 family beta-glucosidase [Tropicimonas sp. S265A]|uniref:GH1 family beta-glucosidase n=1 Tax=Tropicimonas sp. S265A TaxID=3415134 RepID=UPI003C7A2834